MIVVASTQQTKPTDAQFQMFWIFCIGNETNQGDKICTIMSAFSSVKTAVYGFLFFSTLEF